MPYKYRGFAIGAELPISFILIFSLISSFEVRTNNNGKCCLPAEHLQDMICAAIIACHEPKAASGNQIKKYISRYHPDFNVDTKPDRFKKALIRASERNMIV